MTLQSIDNTRSPVAMNAQVAQHNARSTVVQFRNTVYASSLMSSAAAAPAKDAASVDAKDAKKVDDKKVAKPAEEPNFVMKAVYAVKDWIVNFFTATKECFTKICYCFCTTTPEKEAAAQAAKAADFGKLLKDSKVDHASRLKAFEEAFTPEQQLLIKSAMGSADPEAVFKDLTVKANVDALQSGLDAYADHVQYEALTKTFGKDSKATEADVRSAIANARPKVKEMLTHHFLAAFSASLDAKNEAAKKAASEAARSSASASSSSDGKSAAPAPAVEVNALDGVDTDEAVKSLAILAKAAKTDVVGIAFQLGAPVAAFTDAVAKADALKLATPAAKSAAK
jgi:hypothetical protein